MLQTHSAENSTTSLLRRALLHFYGPPCLYKRTHRKKYQAFNAYIAGSSPLQRWYEQVGLLYAGLRTELVHELAFGRSLPAICKSIHDLIYTRIESCVDWMWLLEDLIWKQVIWFGSDLNLLWFDLRFEQIHTYIHLLDNKGRLASDI